MRILHVVIDGELAGGQLVAEKLISGARARGHEALIVSPSRGAFTERAERDGIPVRTVDVSRAFKLGGLLRLRRLIRAERIELVHTHAMLASNLLSRVASRSSGTPVVSHAHGAEVFRPGAAGRVYRLLDNLTARWCARVIAVSDDTRRRLIEQGIPARLIETVYNGLDPPESPPEPGLRALGLDRRQVIACVGRLEPAKGQAELIEAAAEVPDAVVLLIGRDVGGSRSRLERLAAERGVADRVVFAGPRTDVLELVAGCALLAAPSWTEGFPIAPLEAMAVGKPVVATEVGGTPELVANGETGLLVPPRDPDALAAALRDLLADPARAQAMGEAGYRRLRERFSEARMVERVLAIYEEAR